MKTTGKHSWLDIGLQQKGLEEEMVWEETNLELIRLNKILISLHNRPERDWELHEQDAARIVRRKLIDLGEYRYSLLRNKNAKTNPNL